MVTADRVTAGAASKGYVRPSVPSGPAVLAVPVGEGPVVRASVPAPGAGEGAADRGEGRGAVTCGPRSSPC
ncbi:hypothetical protein GCM10010313_67540 [Streptomyces violarus]|nr:hypothetical protein GCM10010313_67540 [Streptomyces violarus]